MCAAKRFEKHILSWPFALANDEPKLLRQMETSNEPAARTRRSSHLRKSRKGPEGFPHSRRIDRLQTSSGFLLDKLGQRFRPRPTTNQLHKAPKWGKASLQRKRGAMALPISSSSPHWEPLLVWVARFLFEPFKHISKECTHFEVHLFG